MTDKEIIATYRGGEPQRAFNEIVRAYSERLYWHVRSIVGSHDDTDDLLQDIFIKIWAALPSFRGEAQLFTWIWRIATNESLNFLKSRKKAATVSMDETPESASRIPDEDARLDGDEAQRLLSVAVSKLPPVQRAVFSMRYYDEMKYEDISEVLGSSVSSLKASYHFAYEKVKDYLLKKITI
mgnify:CR=1 FL=1